MNIQGVPATQVPLAKDTSSSSSSASANSQISESSFLQLIATELQAQDPTNPLDPSQFMGQLVQFNTLDQVTGIYNILSNGAASASGQATIGAAGAMTDAARTPSVIAR